MDRRTDGWMDGLDKKTDGWMDAGHSCHIDLSGLYTGYFTNKIFIMKVNKNVLYFPVTFHVVCVYVFNLVKSKYFPLLYGLSLFTGNTEGLSVLLLESLLLW